MALFTLQPQLNRGLDMLSAAAQLAGGTALAATPTGFGIGLTIVGPVQSRVTGEGLTYRTSPFFGSIQEILTGTITGIDVNNAFGTLMTAERLNLDAPRFGALRDDGTPEDFLAFLTKGRDTVIGTAFADRITGGAGADDLRGGDGADTIIGGAGRDTLSGGNDSAVDVLTGGGGPDRFEFRAALAPDTITDFGRGDLLRFDARGFDGVRKGRLADTAFATGTEATDRNDRFIYDRDSGALWFDADGNRPGVAAVLVATLVDPSLTTTAVLTADDIVIF